MRSVAYVFLATHVCGVFADLYSPLCAVMTLNMDTVEVVSSESTGVKQDGDQDEQDSQMDIIVKGSKSTVNVSWDKENEKGRLKDVEKGATQDAPSRKAKTKRKASKARKAQATDETCPAKTPKLVNHGLRLFVGNLNNSKNMDEVSDTLARFFMTKSVLVQDIKVDRSRRHAYIDLASTFDLKKALKLNGKKLLGRPMKICAAKVKGDKVEKKSAPEEKKALRDGKCVYLKNVPRTATKEDIMKLFRKAVKIRFPGGTESPEKGIAFVEFKNTVLAKKVLLKKRLVKIKGKILIVDSAGKTNKAKVDKDDDKADDKADDEDSDQADDKDKKETDAKAPVAPNNTLFVSNLPFTMNEGLLKDIFQKAVSIMLPKKDGKSKGYAFVAFSTVTDAKQAMQSTHNKKVHKRQMKVQFYQKHDNVGEILPNTLIVKGLSKTTTAETLQAAFEGALSARVAVDKETKVSKGFGFVEFENEDKCRAAKEAMEDCEIDGCQVNVDHALSHCKKRPQGGSEGSAEENKAKEDTKGSNKGSKKGKRKRGKPQDTVEEAENKS